MNVIIDIEGRKAIPVRAIPFVTGGRITPDLVASIFAHTDQWKWRLKDVKPYHLQGDGKYSPMCPKVWDDVELEFQLLLKNFKAKQKIYHEHHPIREQQSIPKLPSACFVWKDRRL